MKKFNYAAAAEILPPVQYIDQALGHTHGGVDGGLVSLDGWKGDGWYFWDETWSHIVGPYKDRQEAEEKCLEYARSLDAPPPPKSPPEKVFEAKTDDHHTHELGGEG